MRHAANPILTAADWPYRVNVVFNPGAAVVDGETVLLARVETRTGISHLTAARSANGIDGWSIDSEPLLAPAEGDRERAVGASKIRAIVWVAELDRCVITCTPTAQAGPAVYLATTTDFRSVERHGIIKRPEDKNAALLPERVERAVDPLPPSDDRLRRLARRDLPLAVRRPRTAGALPSRCCSHDSGAWWDSLRIGIGPPPLQDRARLAPDLPRRQGDGRRRHLPRRSRAGRPGRADARAGPGRRVGPRSGRALRTAGRRAQRRVSRAGSCTTRRPARFASTTARPTPRSASPLRSSTSCSTRSSPSRRRRRAARHEAVTGIKPLGFAA